MVALGVDAGFIAGTRLLQTLPMSRPEAWGITVQRDVPYGPHHRHRLDVYRQASGGPVIMYIHGGAWRMLSKESHFMMGIALARQGFTVVNIDYRLAPKSPYPAPLDDCLRAYDWTLRHASELSDTPGVAVAGESAGANLAVALATAIALDVPGWEHAAGLPTPLAVSAACGLYEIDGVDRLCRGVSWWVRDYLRSMAASYTPRGNAALASPLAVLESSTRSRARLPRFFLGVGTRDPVLADTVRLAAALTRRGAGCEPRYYGGGVHAFHAFVPSAATFDFWRDQKRFLYTAFGDVHVG